METASPAKVRREALLPPKLPAGRRACFFSRGPARSRQPRHGVCRKHLKVGGSDPRGEAAVGMGPKKILRRLTQSNESQRERPFTPVFHAVVSTGQFQYEGLFDCFLFLTGVSHPRGQAANQSIFLQNRLATRLRRFCQALSFWDVPSNPAQSSPGISLWPIDSAQNSR